MQKNLRKDVKFIDPRVSELISLMEVIEKEWKKTPLPKLTKEEQTAGFKSSKLGASQVNEVHMSPLMKNALEHYGDKSSESWRLVTGAPETKAENALIANIKLLALKYNGSQSEYNESLPLLDKRHYDVQCNLNIKDNMRDIVPGQAKARCVVAEQYTKPTNNTIRQIIEKLQNDVVFQKAVMLVMEQIPSVKASDEIKEVNLPFMTKHTGVGYPFWRNDKTIDTKSGKSYAEITMDIAKDLQYKYGEWYKYNVATLYGRNQRGKGRLLTATSRVLNLLLNPLEAVEIAKYKDKSPLFVGYHDDDHLRDAMRKMTDQCVSHGLKLANRDYDTFDLTNGEGMMALVGAISTLKAMGSHSKRIAILRAVFGLRTIAVNGIEGANKLMVFLGRVFSGYIDTNRGGGLANAIAMTYCYMLQDKNYSSYVYNLDYYMLVMGDDNLGVFEGVDRERLEDDMQKNFGYVMKREKYAFGPEFLQYRLFKTDDGIEHFVYAWPRVVRSMLFKEESKGLGPAGWTIAFYMQLSKLLDYDEAFTIAVNLLIPFDEKKFYSESTVEQLIADLKKEDREKLAAANTDAQRRRYQSTFEKLYDGDPTKSRIYNEITSDSKDGILHKVWSKIRDVYDPHFYSKNGLRY